uniref:Secreted protein n=1 Tax=Cannabis sativa TaxID=3483 RepID=A0A803QXB5_CANSA
MFGQESWLFGCFALFSLLGRSQSSCSTPRFLSSMEETCTSSSGQPCSSLLDGSFLCFARGSSVVFGL